MRLLTFSREQLVPRNLLLLRELKPTSRPKVILTDILILGPNRWKVILIKLIVSMMTTWNFKRLLTYSKNKKLERN